MAKNQEVATTKDQPANGVAKTEKPSGMLSILKGLEDKQAGVEMVSEYHEFIEGEPINLIVTGTRLIKSIADGAQSGDTTPAIAFVMEKEGSEAYGISADAVFVSTLKKFADEFDAAPFSNKPTFAFNVVMKGWKGKAPREYRDFSIKPLNAGR